MTASSPTTLPPWTGARLRIPLRDGWRFHRGELEHPPARVTMKAASCGGVSDCVDDEAGGLEIPPNAGVLAAQMPGFSGASLAARSVRTGWEPVDLPHDWRVDDPYSAEGANPGGYPLEWQGFQAPGVGYYRLTFRVPDTWEGAITRVEFEGVMRSSTTWANGHLLGEHASGHTGFEYDLRDILRYGDEGENVLLVRADCTEPEGWWGEGAGIYRPAWLHIFNPTHLVSRGLATRSAFDPSGGAAVDVTVTVAVAGGRAGGVHERAHGASDAGSLEAHCRLLDPTGRVVADATGAVPQTSRAASIDVPAVVELHLDVDQPRRWDVDQPNLYTLVTELRSGGRVLDRLDTSIGLREFVFTADDGFHLNGRRLQLWGANIHQDFGGLGIALPERVIEHKLELLQGMGCNAVRSAHHPPTPHLLDACDRLGMLVIDENRHLSSTAAGLADLDAMILRDRNHTCVVAWSLENEEMLEGTPTGTRILRTLAARALRLDPDRPTMLAGHTRFDDDDYYGSVDVVGFNYGALNGVITDHVARHPDRPFLATEDCMHPTTRGVFEDDVAAGHLSEFGTRVAPFNNPGRPGPEVTWDFHANQRRGAGAFAWSGLDYAGEPFPLGWPSVSSHYGAMDTCGFPKAYHWLLRSYFSDEPVVYLLPHWTWPGREGEVIEVRAYTNCDEVELSLDGVTLGRSRPVMHCLSWPVVFAPGRLVARGLRGGREVARCEVATAGPAAAIVLTADRGDGHCGDAFVVRAAVVDAAGEVVPGARDLVSFEPGPGGVVLGVGNGDPADRDPQRCTRRRAWAGRCMAVVRADRGASLRVSASAPGLAPSELLIHLSPRPAAVRR